MIYYYHDERIPLYLLTIFGKNEQANLTTISPAWLICSFVAHWRRIMGNAFKNIAQGLQEAIEHSLGKTEGSRVHRPEEVDMAAIRKKTGLTQFASL